jgi:hypothetical protein
VSGFLECGGSTPHSKRPTPASRLPQCLSCRHTISLPDRSRPCHLRGRVEGMTEQEWIKGWLTDEDFDFLFDFLGGMVKPTKRKLRLFACNSCRIIWHLITDESSRKAIEVAEQYADSGLTLELLREAHAVAENASNIAWRNARTVEVNGGRHFAAREEVLAYAIPGLASRVTEDEFNEVTARDAVDEVCGVVAHSAISPQIWGTEAGDNAAQQAVDFEIPKLLTYSVACSVTPSAP